MDKSEKSILYIEDETEMIELVRIILSRKGFLVFGAANGPEGLRMPREKA